MCYIGIELVISVVHLYIFTVIRLIYSCTFYRAARMHSAHYAVARGLSLSVCLSHAGILSKRLYISSKFFHRRIAPLLWFSYIKRDGKTPTGTYLTGASDARGVLKTHDFRLISRFISQMMHDRAIVIIEGE